MSELYFDFVGSVWNELPEADRQRFIILWNAYEQVFAAAYQRYAEVNLNVAVDDLLTYSTDRWLPYDFLEDSRRVKAAELVSRQDISSGVNLVKRKQLKLSVDEAPAVTVTLSGLDPYKVTAREVCQSINAAFGFSLATPALDGALVKLTSLTTGSLSSITVLQTDDADKNACEFVLGIDLGLLPKKVFGEDFVYPLPYPSTVSIPEFQDAAGDSYVTRKLSEGVDYAVIRDGTVAFKKAPPKRLWAKRTVVNREIPWKNFGYLLDIYEENTPRYADVLRGLWYALWTGPKPSNVETSLSLLFGLPTAKEDAVVSFVSPLEVKTLSQDGTERVFQVPAGLSPKVSLGEAVKRFQPLTTGIKVFDKIGSPGFLERELGRPGVARFLTEKATRGEGEWTDETRALSALEEFTFLPQVASETFLGSDINLKNIRKFLDAIKPLNKAYLFQVTAGPFREGFSPQEKMSRSPDIDLTSTLDSNETTFLPGLILEGYEEDNYLDLNLDPHGILFEEKVELEVKSSGIIIDSFSL